MSEILGNPFGALLPTGNVLIAGSSSNTTDLYSPSTGFSSGGNRFFSLAGMTQMADGKISPWTLILPPLPLRFTSQPQAFFADRSEERYPLSGGSPSSAVPVSWTSVAVWQCVPNKPQWASREAQ
ncbi:MAG: hypothetical protein C5B58_12075 [Acidobacteria bacterium]|nr:MAG: hypothetical protein C5B58_12075 [Acidobacteriota bacterium]